MRRLLSCFAISILLGIPLMVSAAKNTIIVRGVVTSLPGEIGDGIIYLGSINQKGLPKNLRVDLSPDKRSDLALGDTIRVSGKLGSISGEPRLTASLKDTLLIITHGPALEPTSWDTINRANDSGALVSVNGTITRKVGRGFDLTTKMNETIRVALPRNGMLSYPLQSQVTVVGIYRRNNADDRILLRSSDELVVTELAISKKTTPTKNADPPPHELPNVAYIITGAGLIITAIVLAWRRWRKKPKQRLENSDDLPFEVIEDE